MRSSKATLPASIAGLRLALPTPTGRENSSLALTRWPELRDPGLIFRCRRSRSNFWEEPPSFMASIPRAKPTVLLWARCGLLTSLLTARGAGRRSWPRRRWFGVTSVFRHQIGEAREAVIKIKIDLVGRAVAVLFHQHFRPSMGAFAFLQPFGVIGRRGIGFARFQVIFLAIDEHHHVGVLLDRAGFAQIGQYRPLVVARIHAAGQLRERQDRHVQFLGKCFQTLGDFSDLLD